MRFLTAAALGAAVAAAAPPARAIDVSGAYEAELERDTDLAARGFSAALSQGLGRWFSASASYSLLRTDPYQDGSLRGREEYTTAGAYLGAGGPLGASFDLNVTVGYVRSQVRGLDGFSKDPLERTLGPSGSLTLSFWPHPWIETFAGPAYSYLGREPAWQGNVGANFLLLRGVWFTTSYWDSQVKRGWNLGLRFGGS